MAQAQTVTPHYIKLHEADNVAIVANEGGLAAGSVFGCGLMLRERVPMGHKLALADIAAGGEIRRYGTVIGTALGWSTLQTIGIAVVLAFLFGYALTMLPLLRAGLAFGAVTWGYATEAALRAQAPEMVFPTMEDIVAAFCAPVTAAPRASWKLEDVP